MINHGAVKEKGICQTGIQNSCVYYCFEKEAGLTYKSYQSLSRYFFPSVERKSLGVGFQFGGAKKLNYI